MEAGAKAEAEATRARDAAAIFIVDLFREKLCCKVMRCKAR